MLLTVASLAFSSCFSARHLLGEAGRQRLNRFLLRLLPELLVTGEDRVDRGEERSSLLELAGGGVRRSTLEDRGVSAAELVRSFVSRAAWAFESLQVPYRHYIIPNHRNSAQTCDP